MVSIGPAERRLLISPLLAVGISVLKIKQSDKAFDRPLQELSRFWSRRNTAI
jgi:hypothetical protein